MSALLIVAAAAGCGDASVTFASFHCSQDPPAGVVVEFVSSGYGRPVAVPATGTLRDGAFVEEMKPAGGRDAGLGSSFALAGGHDREGVYEVRVETDFGEVIEWSRIKVSADRCGPFTVVLQARISIFR